MKKPNVINILPQGLVNMIAAGEVVERPASVVKELVENSIDAESEDIIVEIERGGKRLIRVTDDGIGMSKDDVTLAVQRYATSKIKDEDDLFNIITLGFRGEALPSIASVSKMEMITKKRDEVEGTHIVIEGNIKSSLKAVGAKNGTMVEVRDLFFNVPARRKFLKSDATELNHIIEIVYVYALAFPQIQFRLICNGKEMFFSAKRSDRLHRMLEMLGQMGEEELLKVKEDSSEVILDAIISRPTYTKSTLNSMYIFVNNRYVKDRFLSRAVLDGYGTLLPKGRYPIAFVNIEIPPHLVDVNVHPAKREVKFQDQNIVFRSISQAIGQKLSMMDQNKSNVVYPDGMQRHMVSGMAANPRVNDNSLTYTPQVKRESYMIPFPKKETTGYFSSLKILTQIDETYIVAESSEGVVFIDQHAAHERIVYEKLKDEYVQSAIVTFELLIPQTIQLSFNDAKILESHLDLLRKFGFQLEHFGGNTFVLKSVPKISIHLNHYEIILDIVGSLHDYAKERDVEAFAERLLITTSCHTAIRAHEKMSHLEIEKLLHDMDKTPFSSHCPHGRPTFHSVTIDDLKKVFKR